MSSVPTPPVTSSVVSSAPSVTISQLNLKHTKNAHVKYHGLLRGIVAKMFRRNARFIRLSFIPKMSN